MTLTEDQLKAPYVRMPYKLMGVSGKMFAELVRKGAFPEGIHISERVVVWPRGVVDDFIKQCVRTAMGKKK